MSEPSIEDWFQEEPAPFYEQLPDDRVDLHVDGAVRIRLAQVGDIPTLRDLPLKGLFGPTCWLNPQFLTSNHQVSAARSLPTHVLLFVITWEGVVVAAVEVEVGWHFSYLVEELEVPVRTVAYVLHRGAEAIGSPMCRSAINVLEHLLVHRYKAEQAVVSYHERDGDARRDFPDFVGPVARTRSGAVTFFRQLLPL